MWQDEAACKPEDTSIFFSTDPELVAKAKAVCATCPVTSRCLEFALHNQVWEGIFGGLTPDEREALDD